MAGCSEPDKVQRAERSWPVAPPGEKPRSLPLAGWQLLPPVEAGNEPLSLTDCPGSSRVPDGKPPISAQTLCVPVLSPAVQS